MPSTTFYHVSNRNRFGTIKRIAQGKKILCKKCSAGSGPQIGCIIIKKTPNFGIKYNVCKFLEITSKEINITVLFKTFKDCSTIKN